MILMMKKLLELFHKKGLQKINQEEFRIEKVIKKRKKAICQMERI